MRLKQAVSAAPRKFVHCLEWCAKTLKNNAIRRNYIQATRSRTIYYSMDLPRHVGFTDQTLLFGMLYKLGALLGLKYHFTPVRPRPNLSATSEFVIDHQAARKYSGIFEFLGFDWYFSRYDRGEDARNAATIEFDFSQAVFDENNIRNLQDLVNHMMDLLRRSLPEVGLPLHVRFIIRKQIPALSWLHSLPNSLLDFDFSDIYQQFRKLRPYPGVFEKTKPKILLHIRQGDTAVVKTPWNTFIQTWARRPAAYREYRSVGEIDDHQIISVADFEKFYADLKVGLGACDLSTQLHSDGYVRAFFNLGKNLEKLNFTSEQAAELERYRVDYNDRAFAEFRRHPEVKMFVGEDLPRLLELMHAFYTADIVIVGTQQRMLPKQYAYSFADGTGPLLITLFRKEIPYYNYFGNSALTRHCLFVDMEDYRIAEVIESARWLILSRYPGGAVGSAADAHQPGRIVSNEQN